MTYDLGQLGQVVEKEGYVAWFKLTLESNQRKVRLPASREEAIQMRERMTYFKVVISDKPNAFVNPASFMLPRNMQAQAADLGDQGELAIKWAPASMAVIATLKDAYFRQAKVKVVGRIRYIEFWEAAMGGGSEIFDEFICNELLAVEIPPAPPYQFVPSMNPPLQRLETYPRIDSEGPRWFETKMPPIRSEKAGASKKRKRPK